MRQSLWLWPESFFWSIPRDIWQAIHKLSSWVSTGDNQVTENAMFTAPLAATLLHLDDHKANVSAWLWAGLSCLHTGNECQVKCPRMFKPSTWVCQMSQDLRDTCTFICISSWRRSRVFENSSNNLGQVIRIPGSLCRYILRCLKPLLLPECGEVNHRMAEVWRELWKSPDPTLLFKQGYLPRTMSRWLLNISKEGDLQSLWATCDNAQSP